MSEIKQKLIKIFLNVLNLDIKPEEIISLNQKETEEWDSLGHIKLFLAIEGEFKVKFSMEEISELKSFNDILNMLNKKKEI